MSQESKSGMNKNRRGTLIGNTLALGLMTCFAAIFIQCAHWIFPQWNASGVLLVCAIVSLESILSFRIVLKMPTAQRQLGFYRFTEWAGIFVLLKIFTEVRGGLTHFIHNIQLWGSNFPINLLSGEFLLNFGIVLLVWIFSTLFSSDLHLLEIDEAVRYDESVKATPLHNRILRRLIYLGMVVLILGGVMFQDRTLGSRPASPTGIVPLILLFFGLALALLSLTRYASLQSAWRQANVQIPSQIPRRWIFYSLVIIVFLVFFASILPTRYGMGLYETLVAVYGFLTVAIQYLFAIIVFLILSLTYMLSKISKPLQAPIEVATPPPPPQILPPEKHGSGVDVLSSLIFWIVLVVAIILILRQYIQYNKKMSEDLKRFKPLRWLSDFWKRLIASIRNANKKVGAFIQSRLQQIRNLGTSSSEAGNWNYLNLRRLSPRQKVIFYYLALIKRAREASLPRQEDQTPYEYARSLTSSLEDGQEDVQAMTDSFIEARYSRHEIRADKLRRTRSAWEALRRILQRGRKPSDGQPKDN